MLIVLRFSSRSFPASAFPSTADISARPAAALLSSLAWGVAQGEGTQRRGEATGRRRSLHSLQ